MKYMIMIFGGLGATLENRTPEWITGMHELMMKLDTELKEAGEVVASRGLVDPSQAKTVRFTGVSRCRPTGRSPRSRSPSPGTGSSRWTRNGRSRSRRRSSRTRGTRWRSGRSCTAARPRSRDQPDQPGVAAAAVTTDRRIEDLLREFAPQVPGALVRRHGRFDACEDAVQEALLAAARQWPVEGVPDRPRSWLLTVAGRCLVDGWRAESARRRRETAAALDPAGGVPPADSEDPGHRLADRDDTLVLLFLCCHPALSPASQLALTLRAVGGVSTAQIAAAFLVPEATMAKRISRAKQHIRDAGAGFELPSVPERPSGSAWCSRSSTWASTRGTPPVRGRRCSAPTSPPRPSASPACWSACCPAKARSPGCSR